MLVAIVGAGLLTLCASCANAPTPAGTGGESKARVAKPNTVFALADDLGWRESGACGNDFKSNLAEKMPERMTQMRQSLERWR